MSNAVEEVPGEAGQTKIRLTRSSGASCEVYVYAAHVTSWKTADGVERLYMSEASEYATGKAIRGGIPICWPQFSGRGPLTKHGFARTSDSWKVRRTVTQPNPSVTLELRDCEASKDWPFSFVLTYTVTLENTSLVTTLHVVNASDDPLDFNAALHTYFSISDIAQVKISGLEGLKYEDNAKGGALGEQVEEVLMIPGEIDRVYLDAPEELLIIDGATQISVEKAGFPDAVIWNIGEEKAPTIKDMSPGDFRRYVCLEAGAIGQKVVVAPGADWTAHQKFIVSTAVKPQVAELGDPSGGLSDERLEKVEEAFKAKGLPALKLQDAYDIMFTKEEKGEYSWNDFLDDIGSFASNMKNKEELTWEEAKLFFETVG